MHFIYVFQQADAEIWQQGYRKLIIPTISAHEKFSATQFGTFEHLSCRNCGATRDSAAESAIGDVFKNIPLAGNLRTKTPNYAVQPVNPGGGGGDDGGGGGSGGGTSSGGGQGLPAITVSANIQSNTISIRFARGDGAQDPIKVVATVLDSSGNATSQTLYNGSITGATQTIKFFSDSGSSLTLGHWTDVDAQWQTSGSTYHGYAAVQFQVLGNYHHTQYNFPSQSACSGNLVNVVLYNSSCQAALAQYKSDFVSAVNLNGTGIPMQGYYCNVEAYCGHGFRFPGTSGGACSNQTVDATTVATYNVNGGGMFKCGDQVMIIESQGVGTTKTVADNCPACADGMHIDNFSSQPGCTPNSVGDLGSFYTIKLNA